MMANTALLLGTAITVKVPSGPRETVFGADARGAPKHLWGLGVAKRGLRSGVFGARDRFWWGPGWRGLRDGIEQADRNWVMSRFSVAVVVAAVTEEIRVGLGRRNRGGRFGSSPSCWGPRR